MRNDCTKLEGEMLCSELFAFPIDKAAVSDELSLTTDISHRPPDFVEKIFAAGGLVKSAADYSWSWDAPISNESPARKSFGNLRALLKRLRDFAAKRARPDVEILATKMIAAADEFEF